MLKKLIPLTLVALFAATANATNFSYTSFGVDLGKINANGLSEDLNAYGINASLQLNSNVYLLSSYLSAEKNVNGLDVTRESTQLGIGGAIPLMQFVDGFATVSYARAEAQDCLGASCIKANDHGYTLSAGVKAWLTDSIDLLTALGYSELTQSDSDNTSTKFGIGIWPSKKHRFGLGIINGERSDSASISYSYYPSPK
ncbi:MAG: hypothetical protein PF440_06410 [Thiomicrorhabdus sp.]|jgi:hypothetical protein|nr:hypothetical protein [Thiomicrorhabdus sp.]